MPSRNEELAGAMTIRIVEGIAQNGFARVRFDGFGACLSVCQTIGEIVAIDDIRSLPSQETDAAVPEDIPFHTDGPVPDVIAWFCVAQDGEAGESLLVDTLGLLRCLSNEDRIHLSGIDVPCHDDRFTCDDGGDRALLVGASEADWQINYTPWLLPELSYAEKMAVEAFGRLVRDSEPTSFRLAPDEALIVDNWRVLHGRGLLPTHSTRHLKRLWIRTPRRSRSDRIPVNMAFDSAP
jgi:hypothetical protein